EHAGVAALVLVEGGARRPSQQAALLSRCQSPLARGGKEAAQRRRRQAAANRRVLTVARRQRHPAIGRTSSCRRFLHMETLLHIWNVVNEPAMIAGARRAPHAATPVTLCSPPGHAPGVASALIERRKALRVRRPDVIGAR